MVTGVVGACNGEVDSELCRDADKLGEDTLADFVGAGAVSCEELERAELEGTAIV